MEQKKFYEKFSKKGFFFICLLSLLLFASNASADLTITGTGTPLDGTNVGLQDSLYASANASAKLTNSGLATEQAWVESELGAGWAIEDKLEPVTCYPTNQPGVYAFALPDTPTYFFIKTGKVDGTFDHFMYTNAASLDWGVFAPADWGTDANIGKLSHVGVVGSPVPLPAAVWLLGSGLLGLVGIRRRIKK